MKCKVEGCQRPAHFVSNTTRGPRRRQTAADHTLCRQHYRSLRASVHAHRPWEEVRAWGEELMRQVNGVDTAPDSA